jgi:hypothetical protein
MRMTGLAVVLTPSFVLAPLAVEARMAKVWQIGYLSASAVDAGHLGVRSISDDTSPVGLRRAVRQSCTAREVSRGAAMKLDIGEAGLTPPTG